MDWSHARDLTYTADGGAPVVSQFGDITLAVCVDVSRLDFHDESRPPNPYSTADKIGGYLTINCLVSLQQWVIVAESDRAVDGLPC